MREERKETLQKLCLVFRNKLIDLLYSVQTGHPGGSLSCTEILTALYYELMDVDPMNPEKEDRDHLILSKGHGAPMLYLVLAHKGFFPLAELKNLRQTGSMLQGHPCVHKTPGVELSTGPLGLGLSAGLGMALGARLKGYDSYTYVIMGDGEIQEGCIWEAAMSASKFKADHLIGILDNNGVQLDGTQKTQQTADNRNAQIDEADAFPVDNSRNDRQSHENGFHIHDPAQHINDYTSIHIPPAFILRYPSNH